MADQRDVLSAIYSIQDEISIWNLRQYAIYQEEQVPNISADDLEKLRIEHDEIIDIITELNEDIAEYTQMLHRLEMAEPEFGNCGFRCDGRCQTCKNEEYNGWDEVFTGGDY